MHDLLQDGNTAILMGHDTHVLSEADWLIELEPKAGAGGDMTNQSCGVKQ